MPIKMIVLDLDGTCITNDYKITDTLRRFIISLEKYSSVYIATGRSLSDAIRYYRQFNMKNEIICHNGALILNPTTGYTIKNMGMKDATDILSFLLTVQNQYKINNIVVSQKENTYLLNNQNNYLHSIIIDDQLPFHYLDSSTNLLRLCNVQRIIISIEPIYFMVLKEMLIKMYPNNVVCSWNGHRDIIDIANGAVNKWDAIYHLASRKDILPCEIVSFGDGDSDALMLEYSGIGVCMANGTALAKQTSDFITSSDNNHDGVYKFIMKYMPKVYQNLDLNCQEKNCKF
jgi:Cof subfamily protein (haloacid dehalogenase superfamily)